MSQKRVDETLKSEHEPVAWMHNFIEGNVITHIPADIGRHPERWTALYKDPTPCKTCESLAMTVMNDQTYPTAWIDQRIHGWPDCFVMQPDPPHTVPLYNAPPKRELTCVCGAVWEGEMMVHPPRKAAEWFDCTDAQLMDEVRRRGFVIRDAQIDPVKREWVGLTDEEIDSIDVVQMKYIGSGEYVIEGEYEFARAIEAKPNEKNGVEYRNKATTEITKLNQENT